MENDAWYKEFYDKAIILGYRGSVTHGTYRQGQSTDKDISGVIIHPISHYFGFQKQETFERVEGEYDVVIHEARKFVHLLIKQNPSVMELLWIPKNFYIKLTEPGNYLIENRDIFRSKEAHKSFTGYAYSQLKKMEHGATSGYMGEKRKKIVEQFGFDTKNAAHLIRLLRSGVEFLATGELRVQREDNSYLLEIKNGEYKLEEIKKEAERLFNLCDMALITSKLPDRVDVNKAEAVLINILMHLVSVPVS